MENKKHLWGRLIFFAGIFATFLVFYTKVVPIVIYNLDDWVGLAVRRDIFPIWRGWNPSRILPELMMPLTAQLSVYLIYPVTGRFLYSVEIGLSVAVSAAVTVYAFSFFRLVVRKYHASELLGMAYTILSLMLHFVVFRTQSEGNDYLLAGYYDTATFFYYLIPALWNGSLVLYMMTEDYFHTRTVKRYVTRGIFIVAIYFACFSDIYQSGILAIYTGVMLLTELCGQLRRKTLTLNPFRKSFWNIYGLHLLILALWGIACVYDAVGGRSNGLRSRSMDDFLSRLQTASATLGERLADTNKWFIYLLLAAVMIFIVTLAVKLLSQRKKQKTKISVSASEKRESLDLDGFQCLVCSVIAVLFLWLVCAMSVPGYIMRGDVLITVFFFLFIFMLVQIHKVVCRKKAVLVVLPLIMVICFSQMNTLGRTWMIRTNGRVTADTARAVWDDIMDEYFKADQNEEKKAEIHVPLYDHGSNWPIMTSGAYWVSETLYKYGITQSYINASYIADPEFNLKYGISVSE